MAENMASKYRPKALADVVGQDNIKTILANQLASKEYRQAYLFTGGAGTGKTTTARILASEINMGKGNPIEIDGASNNGVDNVRLIIENCRFKMLDSVYRVYIIDEVHMLSTGAFNALLKTLEEPPANTIFIMCTTDPQKIPATIISRVQRFDFKRIPTALIVARLNAIIGMEASGATVDPKALEYIAKLADGGMRDAITLLDTCLGYSRILGMADVITILGTVDYDVYFDFTEHVASSNKAAAITLIEEQYAAGKDLKQFIKGYGNFILDILKFRLLHNMELLAIPSTYADRIATWEKAEDYGGRLEQMLKAFIDLNGRIRWESNVKPVLEGEVMLLCS